jgi:hypothetical protein
MKRLLLIGIALVALAGCSPQDGSLVLSRADRCKVGIQMLDLVAMTMLPDARSKRLTNETDPARFAHLIIVDDYWSWRRHGAKHSVVDWTRCRPEDFEPIGGVELTAEDQREMRSMKTASSAYVSEHH